MVSGCFKEVYRFPNNNTYSTGISSFLQLHPYSFVHFYVFSFLFMLFSCNIANVAQRTVEIVQKSRSREHGDIIILIRTCVDCPRLPRARYPNRVTFISEWVDGII